MEKPPEENLPQININLPAPPNEIEIVKAEMIIDYTKEVIDDIRDDRNQVTELLDNFTNMVMNEGDSNQASKEAIVNLMKIKSEIADKKTRVLDLTLRAFMRNQNTYAFHANQHNEFKITNSSKRNLLKALEDDEEKGKEKS